MRAETDDAGRVTKVLDTGPPRLPGGHAVWDRRSLFVRVADLAQALPAFEGTVSLLGGFGLPLALPLAHTPSQWRPHGPAPPHAPAGASPARAGGGDLGMGQIVAKLEAAGFKGLVPTYKEMRARGLRALGRVIREEYGGGQRFAALVNISEGGTPKLAILPRPSALLAVGGSGKAIWEDCGGGDAEQELWEVMGKSRARGGGVYEVEGSGVLWRGEYPAVGWAQGGWELVERILEVCEEEWGVIQEGHLPMYCELRSFGLASLAEVIKGMGGLHSAAGRLGMKGPWERGVAQRRAARQRAMGGWGGRGEPSSSHAWEGALEACWELCDESEDAGLLASYAEMSREGLPHLALSLRNQSAPQGRLVAGAGLHPKACSGIRFAAEQLGKRVKGDDEEEPKGGVKLLRPMRVGKGSAWRTVEEAREALGEVCVKRGLEYWPGVSTGQPMHGDKFPHSLSWLGHPSFSHRPGPQLLRLNIPFPCLIYTYARSYTHI